MEFFERLGNGIIDAIIYFFMISGMYGLYSLTPLTYLYDPGIDIMILIATGLAALCFIIGFIFNRSIFDDNN